MDKSLTITFSPEQLTILLDALQFTFEDCDSEAENLTAEHEYEAADEQRTAADQIRSVQNMLLAAQDANA